MASRDHLRGTLEVLVLKILTWGPRHGYAIARWLEDTPSEVLQIEELRAEVAEWLAFAREVARVLQVEG